MHGGENRALEAGKSVQKMDKQCPSVRSGDYAYSYIDSYYSQNQKTSYSSGLYSYSYSSEYSKDANFQGANGSASSNSQYSYTMTKSEQASNKSIKHTNNDYTRHSMTDEEYSYSYPEQTNKPAIASASATATNSTSSSLSESGKSESYSYSYSYTEHDPPQMNQRNTHATQAIAKYGDTKVPAPKSDSSANLAMSRAVPSIRKDSEIILSSITGSTESPSLSYSGGSSDFFDDNRIDRNSHKDYSSYYSSSIVKEGISDSYTYSDSATESYSYITSSQPTDHEEHAQPHADDYSYSFTTPYPAHVEKVSFSKSYTGTYDYSSTNPSSSFKTTSESIPIDSKSERTPNTSYEITTERDSVSKTEKYTQRELKILRAPTESISNLPPAPSRCLVPPNSQEDSTYQFLKRLMAIQEDFEFGKHTNFSATSGMPSFRLRRKVGNASTGSSVGFIATHLTAVETSPRKDGGEVSLNAAQNVGDPRKTASQGKLGAFVTPKGYYSERTIRLALNALGLNHLERQEVLRGISLPMEETTLLSILDTCGNNRVREIVAQTFLAHDPHHSGELPLSVVGDVLHRLGLARSPVIDDAFRIDVCPAARTTPTKELFLFIETSQDNASAAGTAKWQSKLVPVCKMMRESQLKNRPMPVHLQGGDIYIGHFPLCCSVPSQACFQRLKTYIEAAVYVCILASTFSYEDEITHQIKIEYPKLVRCLLLPSEMKGRKSIYLQNLFRELCCTDKHIIEFVGGGNLPAQYKINDMIESTLYGTKNIEEKRRRNVIPDTFNEFMKFRITPNSPNEVVSMSLSIRKIRTAGTFPSDARCYCLVSAITVDNVFLPAVEIPVRKMHVSSKGGFTWVFDKKDREEISFEGPRTDRLYIECCYEVNENEPHKVFPAINAVTVWCAGYAVLPFISLRETVTWPVTQGSLLDSANCANAFVSVDAAKPTSPAPPKPPGFFACLSTGRERGGLRKKLASQPAVEIKVKVLKQNIKTSSAASLYEDMPARYIVLSRHAKLISLLRSAIHRIGKLCRHVPQALRQQISQRILLIASETSLMDQLNDLWSQKLKSLDRKKKKDKEYQYELLLWCVSTLTALHNCSSKDQGSFASLLIKHKPLLHPFDVNALQGPVSV